MKNRTFFQEAKVVTAVAVVSSLSIFGGAFAAETNISATPDAKTILSQSIDRTFSSKFDYRINFRFNRNGTLSKDLNPVFGLREASINTSGYANFSTPSKLNLTSSIVSGSYRVNTGERVYFNSDSKLIDNDFYTALRVWANPKQYIGQDVRALAGKWLQPKKGDGTYELISKVIPLDQVLEAYNNAKGGKTAFLDAVKAENIRKEKIDGVDSYLVKITFDKDKSASLLTGNLSGYNKLLPNSTLKLWIGISDSVIRRADLYSSQWSGKEKDTLSISLTTKNAGKDTVIKVPTSLTKKNK